MIVLDASVVTIALPSAQRALHISIQNRQWALTAYTLAGFPVEIKCLVGTSTALRRWAQ